MRNVYFSSSQAPNRVKKILPPIDHSIPFSHKMLQEISIIVYYLRTTQFSICHLFLSLSLPSFDTAPQIHSTQLLYPPFSFIPSTRGDPSFKHPVLGSRLIEGQRESIGSHHQVPNRKHPRGIQHFPPPSIFPIEIEWVNRGRDRGKKDWNTRFTFPFSANIRLIGCWSREFQRNFFPETKGWSLNEVKKVRRVCWNFIRYISRSWYILMSYLLKVWERCVNFNTYSNIFVDFYLKCKKLRWHL